MQEQIALIRNKKVSDKDRVCYFFFSQGFVKIGQSTNGYLKRRLSTLRVGCPTTTWLIGVSYNRSAELTAKQHLHKHRVRGEWYQLSGPVINFIVSELYYCGKEAPDRIMECQSCEQIYTNGFDFCVRTDNSDPTPSSFPFLEDYPSPCLGKLVNSSQLIAPPRSALTVKPRVFYK